MGKSRRRRGWPEVPQPLVSPVIDNHTHLPVFEGEIPNPEGVRLSLAQQRQRWSAANIAGAITCGCELPCLEPTVALAGRFANVWAAIAIHPNEAALHAGVSEKSPDGQTPRFQPHHQVSIEDAVARVQDLAAANPQKVVAIGETGLDYFRTAEAGRAAQLRSFRAHIELAKSMDLPLQIHDRDAHADVVDTLLADGAPRRTVFHCFSGGPELARVCAENGWYASFAGPVTFNANQYLRDAVAALGASQILVETDAPYLTPHPYRGQPNSTYMIGLTVRQLAATRGVGEDEMCAQLRKNTAEVYGIAV